MDTLLDLSRGPLFRFSFGIMVLGLSRILILEIWGMVEAYRKAGDKKMPWALTVSRTLEWLFPVKRVMNHRPIYSIISILFHVGLLIVPVFLFDHVRLWEKGIGVSWVSLPRQWADILTVTTILFGFSLFLGRVGSGRARAISRRQDYLWPLILILPFLSGFICSSLSITPHTYKIFMIIHVLSGELIFLLLPFTKIAHCILMPLSQLVMAIAWKFPASVDDEVCATLGKKGARV